MVGWFRVMLTLVQLLPKLVFFSNYMISSKQWQSFVKNNTFKLTNNLCTVICFKHSYPKLIIFKQIYLKMNRTRVDTITVSRNRYGIHSKGREFKNFLKTGASLLDVLA